MGHWDTDTHRGKITWGHKKKTAVCKPRREAEILPHDPRKEPTCRPLILDFWFQNRDAVGFWC